ncbi:hypothetical protein [Lacticaseibacillus suibinensis]|uniref:hypothetical protein n=1 Tax=Lacticaseibacillus suibinensis TaxID=2486011 RepID=UPI000F7AF595|nr:hypothetical protein [Lacticaseibacillus suibinensis]
MNEIVFVRDRLNVVDAQFFHHGMAQGKVYSWYLPSYRQPYTRVGQVVRLHLPGFRRNVQILALHFELEAEATYQSFPAIRGVNGWQVQHIREFLKERGYQVYQERVFRGLKNQNGTPLPVDLCFKVAGQWAFIEYNGMHHYLRDRPHFQNYAANMEVKRRWCQNHQVPMLEIPYWWQDQLDSLVARFLQAISQQQKV